MEGLKLDDGSTEYNDCHLYKECLPCIWCQPVQYMFFWGGGVNSAYFAELTENIPSWEWRWEGDDYDYKILIETYYLSLQQGGLVRDLL